MKKLHPLLSVLFLILGCSTDIETLNHRGGKYYEINSEEPFSGSVNSKYKSGQNKLKGYLKNGKEDGLWVQWYENGQKEYESTYKDGKQEGLWTNWDENGRKLRETTYKDGKQILYKLWNEDGSEGIELDGSEKIELFDG